MKKIVIIGNGVAGMSAANEIRRLDEKAEITIISRESEHFFSRTALMYEYCGQMSRKDIEPYERNHYDRMNFKRINGVVSKVNAEAKSLKLSEGQEIKFDYLLIASGSTANKLPWQTDEIKNVGHFVTLGDLEWLTKITRENGTKPKSVAIIGGGLIGIETAEILALEGIEVNFLIREEWYWPIALNKTEGRFVAENMRSHGVNVLLNTEATENHIEGDKLKGFTLSNGERLDVDFLVATIGVHPETDFLQDSGIAISDDRSKAIEANEYLQTNYDYIYTAGDCANVTWFNGVRRPEQLWYTGRDQGLIAAKNICEQEKIYARGPMYNSAKLFDIEYTTAGLVNFPESVVGKTTEWYQEIPEQHISQRIVLKDGKIIGFNALGSRWDHSYFIRWIEEKRDLEFVLENMRQAQFDAEFSPKFKVLDSAGVSA